MLVNAVLTNGARYYVDHAHPEISTPEVTTAREALVWDRAAEEIVRASMQHVRALLPDGGEIIVHKNNSDGKGNSYGCHENYLHRPRGAVRAAGEPDHPALRDPAGVLRGRQGRLRTARPPRRSRAVPAQPARRLLRGGDRARDHAEAPDRQHPRRTARRRPEVPPPPRDRRRREHERGRHLHEGRPRRRSCWR